jgi:predicted AAA+ superfamily ATPase
MRTLPIASESVRQRQSNPRKLYPIDPGLIGLFDRRGQRQLGQRLETVVALELWRRGYELAYGLTPEREAVDFVARRPDGTVLLVPGVPGSQRSRDPGAGDPAPAIAVEQDGCRAG